MTFRVVTFQLPILEPYPDFRARPARVVEQSHEAPVARTSPRNQLVGEKPRPAGPFDGPECGSGPIEAALHGRKQRDLDFLAALDMVAHRPRRTLRRSLGHYRLQER